MLIITIIYIIVPLLLIAAYLTGVGREFGTMSFTVLSDVKGERNFSSLLFSFTCGIVAYLVTRYFIEVITSNNNYFPTLLRFTAEQQDQLKYLLNCMLADMDPITRLREGAALLQALNGLYYDSVQLTILYHFSDLHECVMLHISTGTPFDSHSFLSFNSARPAGYLNQISEQDLSKFCQAYSEMLMQQADMISAFKRGETPDPQTIKNFLHTSRYCHYFLEHLKSPIFWKREANSRHKLDWYLYLAG